MRHVVTVLMLMAAVPTFAAPAELAPLETKLQTLFVSASARTSGDDVVKALRPTTSEVNDECDEGCQARLNFDGGKTVPYYGTLGREAKKLDSAAYYAGKPFTADTWYLSVTIDPEATPALCFTTAGWNAALVKAGWSALSPSTRAYTVAVSDDPAVRDYNRTNLAEMREITAKIWESRKDGKRILLATAIATLTDRVSASDDIRAAQVMSDCVRTVNLSQDP